MFRLLLETSALAFALIGVYALVFVVGEVLGAGQI